MSERLTAAEFAALCDLAHEDREDFELVPGRTVSVRGVTADEYVAHVVRRFESVKIAFTMSAEAELKRARKAGQGVVTDLAPKALEYLESQIQDAPEAKAAFMAAGCGFGGDAGAERAIMTLPRARKDGLFELVGRKTWGSDPQGFFGEVGTVIAGLQAAAVMTSGATTPANAT